jgi:hypothetical protein
MEKPESRRRRRAEARRSPASLINRRMLADSGGWEVKSDGNHGWRDEVVTLVACLCR